MPVLNGGGKGGALRNFTPGGEELDGRWTHSGKQSAASMLLGGGGARAVELFRAWDKDGSGRVNLREFSEGLRNALPDVDISDDEIDELWAQVRSSPHFPAPPHVSARELTWRARCGRSATSTATPPSSTAS